MFFKRKNIKELDDRELIREYKSSRNNKYIGILFNRYGHLVFGVCLKYLKNTEDSKDAVSQIFEKLMNDLLRMEVKNFKSWIYMVSKNHCLMQLRKNKPGKEQDIQELENQISEDENLEKIELKDAQLDNLSEAIKELKEEQKQCVELFYLQEKSYDEVADITGYNLKQVKSYIQNGKRNLKIKLATDQNQ